MNKQIKSLSDAPYCDKCTSWNMDVNDEVISFLPPPNYPKDYIPSTGKIFPIKMTYGTMSKAVTEAHNHFISGKWNAKNCEAFLKVNGLNKQAIKHVIDNASNEIIYKNAEANKEKDNRTYQLILEVKKRYPESFQCWKFPALWTQNSKLTQHIDSLMHLLMLGIQKTTMMKIKLWNIKRSSQTSFYNYTNGILESIQDLNLNWCKVLPYKKKDGRLD